MECTAVGRCATREVMALAILEQNGRFSVLRAGEKIHPAALTGVRHANELRDRLRERSH